MTTLDKLDAARFTAEHLLKTHAQHPDPEAMLRYTCDMAAMLCDFMVARFGPKPTYYLMQSLADDIIESQPHGR